MEFNKILVPLDFSDFSDRALDSAIQFASTYGASLTLIHVLHALQQHHTSEESRLIDYRKYVNSRDGWAERELAKRCERSRASSVDAEPVLLRGQSPAAALENYLAEGLYDLVIMGTHGQTGLKHFIRGNVAAQMVVNSPVPVLTIHRSVRTHQIRRIAVPVDFSAPSAAAAQYAVSIAQKLSAELIFLHVIEQEVDTPRFFSDDADFILGFDQDLHSLVEDNLQEFVADLHDGGIQLAYMIRRGVAHKEICDFAREESIDLIVIATHGQGGQEYLLIGSTAEEVTRWASCPVLTVRCDA